MTKNFLTRRSRPSRHSHVSSNDRISNTSLSILRDRLQTMCREDGTDYRIMLKGCIRSFKLLLKESLRED